jgi:DNA-binding Lrp family transcriptional regulator
MDPLDLGILRELSRDQVVWFGRPDPRFSLAEIGRELHVDRTTVAARLRRWQNQGFLRGHEVVPSPGLFGASVAGGTLRVDRPTDKPRVLEELALIPGLLSAVDHVGPWVALLLAFDTREGLERSRRLLARTAGVSEVSPCVPLRTPEPAMAPSPSDWAVLRALRVDPRRPASEVARAVGLSTKTLARRMERLVAGRAVWYLPLLDFTRFTGATFARFLIVLRPGADGPAVAREAARLLPQITYLVDLADLAEETQGPALLDVGAYVDSLGLAEDAQRELQASPSVDDVEILYPRRFYLFGSWFDERLEVAGRPNPVVAGGATRSRRAVSSGRRPPGRTVRT